MRARPSGPRRRRRGRIGGSNVSWRTGVKRCEVYHGTRATRVLNLFPPSPCLRYRHSDALFEVSTHRTERREATMIDAAVKALAQMFSPPFRWVLLKSAGLALVLIVLIAIGLHR